MIVGAIRLQEEAMHEEVGSRRGAKPMPRTNQMFPLWGNRSAKPTERAPRPATLQPPKRRTPAVA
jgi:hypothetical protein